jgi:hypothetical protein
MAYAVKECFYTLQGEGRAERPAGGVPPLSPGATSGPVARRIASPPSAGSATRISSASGLMAASSAMPAHSPNTSTRAGPPTASAARTQAGGLHRRRAVAPARRSRGRCAARPRLRGGRRDQRHAARTARPRSHLRQSQGQRPTGAHAAARSSSSSTRKPSPTRSQSALPISTSSMFYGCSRWMALHADAEIRAGRARVLPRTPAMAPEPADAQMAGDPMSAAEQSGHIVELHRDVTFEAAHSAAQRAAGPQMCAGCTGTRSAFVIVVRVARWIHTPAGSWTSASIKAAWSPLDAQPRSLLPERRSMGSRIPPARCSPEMDLGPAHRRRCRS